ncbi:hypothetical protein ABKN59_009868 [Abortiporus biennis]
MMDPIRRPPRPYQNIPSATCSWCIARVGEFCTENTAICRKTLLISMSLLSIDRFNRLAVEQKGMRCWKRLCLERKEAR